MQDSRLSETASGPEPTPYAPVRCRQQELRKTCPQVGINEERREEKGLRIKKTKEQQGPPGKAKLVTKRPPAQRCVSYPAGGSLISALVCIARAMRMQAVEAHKAGHFLILHPHLAGLGGASRPGLRRRAHMAGALWCRLLQLRLLPLLELWLWQLCLL